MQNENKQGAMLKVHPTKILKIMEQLVCLEKYNPTRAQKSNEKLVQTRNIIMYP